MTNKVQSYNWIGQRVHSSFPFGKTWTKPNLRHIWQPHLLTYDSEKKYSYNKFKAFTLEAANALLTLSRENQSSQLSFSHNHTFAYIFSLHNTLFLEMQSPSIQGSLPFSPQCTTWLNYLGLALEIFLCLSSICKHPSNFYLLEPKSSSSNQISLLCS